MSNLKASEYCKNVFDGTHDTPKPEKSGYKLLTSKHILNGVLDKENAYFISENDYKAINKRSQVHQWDILFSMIGTVGNIYIVTEKDKDIDFAIKNMGVFSCGDEYKAKWLYFYLKTPLAKKQINNFLNGAVQKFVSLGWLRDFVIPEYSQDKKKIVDSLWNIEAKITNNNKINAELESLAKTIYDYWFFQFEFPNAEGKPYKSSGGKMVWNEILKREIPIGWDVSNIKKYCEITDCLHSKKPDYYFETEDSYLLSLENLTKDGHIDLTKKYFIKSKDYNEWIRRIEIKENDFVVTNAGRAGDICKVPKNVKCAIGRNITAIRPFNIDPNYLYCFFKSIYIKEQIQSNLDCGSFFMSFNVDSIKKINLLVPRADVLNKASLLLHPIIKKIEMNIQNNMKLSSLRDFLLPMLMNGQVLFKEG